MTLTSTVASEADRALRRARRTFWTLVAIAVLAAGWLSTALAAAASAFTGLQVATSGLVLISAVVLAARVLSAVERARRRSTDQPPHKE
ncbi:MAG: hypothetical protein ABIQ92_06380 [Ornithinibacter sp.]